MTDSALPTLAPPILRIAAGGCRVAAVSRPDERRACLIVEVAAGSHDEPPAWPGLAHFLEHLLFLGGAGYPAERRLLPFVQASGGRVNASTGVRLTEYHCEVPAELLEEAGLRLLDMLARPRFDADAQLAEAQVLQAEYLARGADPRQQGLCALLDALAPGHPCHAFVAGNGASLAPRRDDFRAAVTDFHQRFYRAGNCRLMLVGPQPAPELLALGERLAELLIPGEVPTRSVPPAMLPLRACHWHLGQASAAPRLWLGLVLEGHAEGARAELGWLREQLSSDLPDSLQQQLREAGLIDGWDVQSAYAHAGQALLALEVEPVADDDRACAQVRAALLRWLSALAARAPWREALETQAAERPWQLTSLAPLELGRFWLEQGVGQPDGDALRNLTAMLAGVGEERLISVRASASLAPATTSVCGFPLALEAAVLPFVEAPSVSLVPPGNPLLAAVPHQPGECPSALARHGLDAVRAALHLRWVWPAPLNPLAGQVLARRLQVLRAAGERLGIDVRSEFDGGDWQLVCEGPVALLPAVVQCLRQSLGAEWTDELERSERLLRQARMRERAQMPIRRLLQQLPRVLAGLDEEGADWPMQTDWRDSRWHGLLVGPDALAERLAADLALLPGRPALVAPALAATGRGSRDYQGPAGGDVALLLFCPQPESTSTAEAVWRWLGQWLQAAFYRRMREELRLGYGLFSGFRQVGGRGGLLFAIQSPGAGAAELLAHVDAFLEERERHLLDLSHEGVAAVAGPLADHLRGQAREPRALAELLWQWRLAGGEGTPEQLAEAIAALTPAALAQAFGALRDHRHNRLVLTSTPAR
ncbi:pyrroloquinoline quinone biosynthesis protein PqqF [Pseudomonas paralcaligenes]|uniref:pyrroloquinoline quinone biosynthesis protein PqqF n=1 Tax=Pseudomonas paralcaligenes TaxID=2772558 RepID=UPI001C81D68A|nr:pyrroloquinoline quinone biosynthesis protein PqqF [Pseudomonas paralcaligenes]